MHEYYRQLLHKKVLVSQKICVLKYVHIHVSLISDHCDYCLLLTVTLKEELL